MMTRRPRRLDHSQAVHLMGVCFDNAERLRSDADLLFDGGRYQRASYLYATSLEELGKLPMIARSPQFGDDAQLWMRFWRKFKTHKLKLISRPAFLELSLLHPDVARELEWFMQSIGVLKQRALYVDFQHGKVLTPTDIPIWRDLCEALRLAVGFEISLHRFIVEHIREDILEMVGSAPAAEPLPGESVADFLARTAPQELAKFGVEVPPREPGEDSRSYALRIYEPVFKPLWTASLDGSH